MSKRLLLLVLATGGLLSCVATARPSPAFYITKPAAQLLGNDSASAVTVYFDERTLVWLNATLAVQRHEFREAGVCLRIAQQTGDAFKVDSFIPGQRPDWPGGDTVTSTWRQTAFSCPRGWAPLHFHIIQPKDSTWLLENGHGNYLPVKDCQCRVAGADLNPYFSRYPFNSVMCGYGIDSVITYRVRR